MDKELSSRSHPKFIVESLPIKVNLEASRLNSPKKKRRREPKEPQLDKYSDRAKPPIKKASKT